LYSTVCLHSASVVPDSTDTKWCSTAGVRPSYASVNDPGHTPTRQAPATVNCGSQKQLPQASTSLRTRIPPVSAVSALGRLRLPRYIVLSIPGYFRPIRHRKPENPTSYSLFIICFTVKFHSVSLGNSDRSSTVPVFNTHQAHTDRLHPTLVPIQSSLLRLRTPFYFEVYGSHYTAQHSQRRRLSYTQPIRLLLGLHISVGVNP